MHIVKLSSNALKVVLGNGLAVVVSNSIEDSNGKSKNAHIQDTFTEIDDNCFRLDRVWNLEEGDYRIKTDFESTFLEGECELFVPAVMYRGNEEGKGSFPRLSISKVWSFHESRSSIPACVQLIDGKHSLIVSSIASEKPCGVSWSNHTISEMLPSIEQPLSYSGKNTLKETTHASYGHFSIVRKSFVVFAVPSKSMLEDYCSFVDLFAKARERGAFEKPEPIRHDWKDIEALLLTHLLSLVEKAKDSEDEYYLLMGRGNGEQQYVYEYTAASFLVKSLEGAVVLASTDTDSVKAAASPSVAGILLEEEKRLSAAIGLTDSDSISLYRKISKGIAKFFFHAEHSPGIFQDCYDLNRDIWGGYLGIGENSQFNSMVNARCNGEAMMSYLNLSDLIPELKPQILALTERVADFYVANQLPDGSFGRWWMTTGECANQKGTNGAYILMFLIALNKRKQDKRYTEAIWKAAEFYSKKALNGDFFGDTLDADSCDKESGEALLCAMMDLWDNGFRVEGFLDAARNAARFVTTWIFQDSIHFGKDTPMGALDFDSQGMTSASIANEHLDFYGFLISYDFLRLYRATGESFFLRQAKMMLRACRQFICSPEQDLGSDKYGWQPEQFNHTEWDYYDLPKRRGVYSIDIAWVTVLSLGALTKLKKEFPECVSL